MSCSPRNLESLEQEGVISRLIAAEGLSRISTDQKLFVSWYADGLGHSSCRWG